MRALILLEPFFCLNSLLDAAAVDIRATIDAIYSMKAKPRIAKVIHGQVLQISSQRRKRSSPKPYPS